MTNRRIHQGLVQRQRRCRFKAQSIAACIGELQSSASVDLRLFISFVKAAVSTLAGLLAPAILQAVRQSSAAVDHRQEARTLASRNAIYGGQKPPEDQDLL